MATIKCSTEGCTAVFETTDAVSPKATYSCKLHTPRSKSNKVRFQQHQFDKDLRRSRTPMGTSHLHNQGSDIITADDFTCERCDSPIVNGECEC